MPGRNFAPNRPIASRRRSFRLPAPTAPSQARRPARRQGADWIVSVEDNGIGIAVKHRDRIFDIFQRLHSQQDYPGRGVGLAVCRRVVGRHGGRIWVESEPGKGCAFHFSLPAMPADH